MVWTFKLAVAAGNTSAAASARPVAMNTVKTPINL